ncbi:MAG: site-specific integrase, partial [Micrococcales bacterium]|nr:site-specific integrase [Micrococcales bacterium]
SVRVRTGTRGATTWAVLYRQNGTQRSRTFGDEKSALRYDERIHRLGVERAERMLAAEGASRSARAPSIAQVVSRHIDGLSGVQADTLAGYRAMARQLAETPLGAMPAAVATRQDVAGWIRDQERDGSASKTIRNKHALLSAALTRATEDGIVERNVAARARISRTERREMVVLTPVEFQVLLARATPHYRPLLMWLYGTGMRLGEATAIEVGDVHLEFSPPTVSVARATKASGKGGIVGAPKTAAGRRTLSIPGPVVEAIAPLMKGRKPHDLLFTNLAGHRILEASLHDLWQTWVRDWDINRETGRRVKRKPTLGKVPRIHDLRHSHAAFMIGQGISLYDLKRRLGHESITTTADTYGHLMPEAQVQAERAAALAFGTAAQVPQVTC